MKLTKRKGFNFFRSYYDVYNELSDKDKVAFMDALLDRQFLGKKPENLKGMAKFAYISQTNSIDSQVKGYEDKTGQKLTPTDGSTEPPTDGGSEPPSQQGEVEVEEEVQVENNLERRKAAFKDLIRKVETERRNNKEQPYSTEMLKDFFEFWSEHGVNDKKMRYEKQVSFSVKRRLSTWKKNQAKFDTKKDDVWVPPKLKEL